MNENLELESEEVNVDSKRKLATIQTIELLSPIPDADVIELATMVDLGWNVVVKKGEFEVGDKCVYVEIDSVLPDKEWSKFLEPSKFRIKTIRLRGQISQGICFPISVLENYGKFNDDKSKFLSTPISYIEYQTDEQNGIKYPIELWDGSYEYNLENDTDVTDILGIKKYVPKTFGDGGFMSGKSAGNFPSFIPKTDETRIQSLKGIVEAFVDTQIYITEKVDGCSATYFYNNQEFGVCSRNRMVKDDDTNVYWLMAKKYNIKEKLEQIGKNIAIQGEIVGPKIQGNKLRLENIDLFVFDFFDIDKYEYFEFDKFNEMLELLQLKQVPFLREGVLHNDIDSWVKHSATMCSTFNFEIWAEGIVIRSIKNINDDSLKRKIGMNRISLKVINPEFSLKYDKRNK